MIAKSGVPISIVNQIKNRNRNIPKNLANQRIIFITNFKPYDFDNLLFEHINSNIDQLILNQKHSLN